MSSSSSARQLYRQFLETIQHWPLDKAKQERDLGLFIRSRVSKQFPNGEHTIINNHNEIEKLKKELEALKRLTNNINRDSNNHNYSTVTGLSAEHLQQITSTDSLRSLNKVYDSGIFNSLKYRFLSMFGK